MPTTNAITNPALLNELSILSRWTNRLTELRGNLPPLTPIHQPKAKTQRRPRLKAKAPVKVEIKTKAPVKPEAKAPPALKAKPEAKPAKIDPNAYEGRWTPSSILLPVELEERKKRIVKDTIAIVSLNAGLATALYAFVERHVNSRSAYDLCTEWDLRPVELAERIRDGERAILQFGSEESRNYVREVRALRIRS